jgi:hypothetical protein
MRMTSGEQRSVAKASASSRGLGTIRRGCGSRDRRIRLRRQPASPVFTVICEWAFEIPRFRAIRGILRRLCVSDRAPKVSFPPPVSEGYFSCLVMEHSASVPVDPTNAPDADASLCGACAPRRNMREGAQEVATRGLDGARWPPVDGSAASAKSRWCERFGRPPFRLAHADLAVQTSLGQGLRGSRRSTVPG